MPTPEEKSLTRYKFLVNLFEKYKKVESRKYEAVMMSEFGLLPRTVARYINTMLTLELIEVKDGFVLWKGVPKK